MTTPQLRKAAILIASLDSHSADALLDQFTPEQAQLVRNAIMEMDEIDEAEQQAIFSEFFGRDTKSPSDTASTTDSVELSESLRHRLDTATSDLPQRAPLTASGPHAISREVPQERPFQWLVRVALPTVCNLLKREHPQTAAIVVAHLPPDRASKALDLLPLPLQSDILSRIARLDRTSPEILREVEREMETQLNGHIDGEPFEVTGLAAVSAILQASNQARRRDLITELQNTDNRLADHLSGEPSESQSLHASVQRRMDPIAGYGLDHAPASMAGPRPNSSPATEERHATLSFADLEQLPSHEFAQLLHVADRQTILLALAGASHSFVQRLLNKLPAREATQLNNKIQNLGPLRLTDIDMAQRQLAQLAQRLMAEGHIQPPANPRFAAAV